MKKLLLITAFAILCIGLKAQTVVLKDGVYRSITTRKEADKGTDTGKVYQDSKGNKYPIMISTKGRYYVVRTSGKTGNKYKQYINITL